MSLKLKFIEQACAPGANVSAVCREFGVSRQTGHKWLRRYREQGYLGLVEQSRRPHSSPLVKSEEMVTAIVELRDRRPSWGPDKIARVLMAKFGSDAPARSTVARVLRRLGKVKRRRTPVRVWSVEGKPYVEAKAPNDLWTIDFKGWWRARNGQRCEPLTVRDAFSRYVLTVRLMSSINGSKVRRVLQRLFEEHGVPAAIQCDNGPPWVSVLARGGLTKLSVWLLSLGIRLIRSRPACPQDNGGHERMHRDLGELQLTPAKSRRAQQPQCDRWAVDFNHVRPHAALGGKTPAEVYRPAERRPVAPRMPSYPPEWRTRRVTKKGVLCFQGDHVRLGKSLGRQLVGLRYENGLRWRAFYFEVDLGIVEIASLDGVVSAEVSTGDAASVNDVTPNQEAQPGGAVSV
jgi:transposase InsO family protein